MCRMCMLLSITVIESLEYLIPLGIHAEINATTHAQGITNWKDNQIIRETRPSKVKSSSYLYGTNQPNNNQGESIEQ